MSGGVDGATPRYDVAIIGSGVIGCCTARELAKWNLGVIVVDGALDIASGASRANSGIVHAGYDPAPGSLKASYNMRGAALFPKWQSELGFAYWPNGALVVAFDDAERARLDELLARAEANGVEGCSIIDSEELHELEPHLAPDALAALRVPTSGICDPYGLAYGAAENAAANGVEFALGWQVSGIGAEDGRWQLTSADGRSISARAIVNAAGTHADEVARMAGGHAQDIRPRRGEYLLFHNKLAGTFRHTIFRAGGASGKGVLVSPVVFGNIFVGPNAEEGSQKDDVSTSHEGLSEVLRRARELWPELPEEEVISTYAGLRATSATGDFRVGEDEDAPDLFHAAGIDSPGLASAPAIAEDLAKMVAGRLGAEARSDFDPIRIPAPLLEMMGEEDVRALVEANPAYGEEVCHCCHTSEGELVEAMRRAIPVLSLDALKWRCGARMGPCHGGRCTAHIAQLMVRELGVSPLEIRKRDEGSELLVDAPCDAEAAREALGRAQEALDGLGVREVGSGALGIAGPRPAGVCSAVEALGLMAETGLLPGRRVLVWGTHEAARIAQQALVDAGMELAGVLEGAQARVTSVHGMGRLEGVTVTTPEGEQELACDLLIASPTLIPLD